MRRGRIVMNAVAGDGGFVAFGGDADPAFPSPMPNIIVSIGAGSLIWDGVSVIDSSRPDSRGRLCQFLSPAKGHLCASRSLPAPYSG